jgi:hypothetical protein
LADPDELEKSSKGELHILTIDGIFRVTEGAIGELGASSGLMDFVLLG